MEKIYDLNNAEISRRKYGGLAGSKLGIILNGENWLIKFPKSTKDLSDPEISYTTTPLSEYYGSHIYESIGIDTQKTILGIFDEKLVVGCKDFRKPGDELYEYREIKNEYVRGLEEQLFKISSSSSLNKVDLCELMIIMDINPTFLANPNLKKRFWDMFVIDAFIGNNDRNNGNWGVIFNENSKYTTIAPVYDNGAAFSNKMGQERMQLIMEDEDRFLNSVYLSRTSIFAINDKSINPLKYIEEMENEDLNNAILKIVPCIDLDKIKNIIYDVPENFNNIEVAPKIVKDFYYKTLEYRYKKILYPVYLKLKERK